MKDFYTLHTETGDSALMENLLSVWDNDTSLLINRLADTSRWPPSDSEEFRLGFWFALLLCRSPQFRRHSEALAEYLTHVVLEVSGNAETTRATADDALRHQNEYIRLMLKTASNIVDCLIERHWLLMRFDTGGLSYQITCPSCCRDHHSLYSKEEGFVQSQKLSFHWIGRWWSDASYWTPPTRWRRSKRWPNCSASAVQPRVSTSWGALRWRMTATGSSMT